MTKEIEELLQSENLFCKKGHLTFPEKVKYDEREITARYCRVCNEYYKTTSILFKDEMKSSDIPISEREYKGEEIKGYKCEDCGSNKGYSYSRQMEPGDEPPVILIRCGSCGATTRKGGK